MSQTKRHLGSSPNHFSGPPHGWKLMKNKPDTMAITSPTIVDSSIILIYLPANASALPLTRFFNPPATNSPLYSYTTDCNATASALSMTIGGKTF
ncbi:hypothetical protein LTR50_003848 [Elasticomyces elasticus]|nr:hypothetical protein LTR50_003848 [Elasticomyces elasticus]